MDAHERAVSPVLQPIWMHARRQAASRGIYSIRTRRGTFSSTILLTFRGDLFVSLRLRRHVTCIRVLRLYGTLIVVYKWRCSGEKHTVLASRVAYRLLLYSTSFALDSNLLVMKSDLRIRRE
jgi:hypothetical protein